MSAREWTCASCGSSQIHDTHCQSCDRARFKQFEVMICEHILEHIADGAEQGIAYSALDVLKLMNARPCYARINSGNGFQISFIQSRMRSVQRDTTGLARAIAKARSAGAMLRVFEHGSPAELINAMAKWGPETNAEHVETKVDAVTRHVVELHEGPPPRKDA